MNVITLKQCSQCGVDKEFTSQYFRVRDKTKGTLRGICRECENKGRYPFTCLNCGNDYLAKRKDRDTYCSRECAYSHKSDIKEMNIVRKRLVGLLKGLLPKEEYTIKCGHCDINFSTTHKGIRYCSDECRKEVNRIANANRTRPLVKECKVCSKLFHTEYKGGSYTYCSRECEGEALRVRRRESKQKRKYRKKVLKHSGEFDNSITLERVISKHNSVCYLCGDECDMNDHVITNEGHFIAGPTYPSIEHIYPISKGGSHTWDNINLAHCRCNRDKSDSVLFEESGQMTLSV